MRISLVQMDVQPGKGANLERAAALIETIVDPYVVVLPEMFCCPYEVEQFPLYAEEYPTGEAIQFLAKTANQKSIFLIGGSIPERCGQSIFNSCFVFNPAGELVARYRKIHLFDVSVSGGPNVQESATLSPGTDLSFFTVDDWTVGLSICYDLRFPELLREISLQGAQLVIAPAAFSKTTGIAHWEHLLKMRAVDNQVYIAGISPARGRDDSYEAYGHSMVVDPWGDIVAEAGIAEEVITVEIEKERVAKIRQELPLLTHRKPELYASWSRRKNGHD